MGSRHDYAMNRRSFAFFGSVSGVVDCDWRRKNLKNELVSHFCNHEPSFRKTMCAIDAKQHKCFFLVLENNIQNLATGFALFTVVETKGFIG